MSKSDVEMIKGSIMYSFKKTPSQWNYGIIVESFIEGKFDPILQKIREKIDIPQLFSETMIDLQLQIDFDSVGKMFA